ncbi:MAG TPA: M23 family metallopeptidase [Telluria sp.]
MKTTKLFRNLIAMAAVGAVTGMAHAAPAFQMPFGCNQVWSGSTRTSHGQLYAVDMNRSGDLGDPVVAAAAGRVVTRSYDSGGYGNYVVVDHGAGWKTYYAHLNSFSVSLGTRVTLGQRIGTVGNTGRSSGPHLHHEQRANGVARKIIWNGSQIYYFGTRNYTSRNRCSAASTAPGTGNAGEAI